MSLFLLFLLVRIYAVTSLTPQDYVIQELPLYNGTVVGQYSGYIDLGDEDETALFFWFVESMNNPSTDPVILWLNGGPGASSVMYGFWTEHGPFRLFKNATSVVDFNYSWNRIANMIYLETPSGVGFSYSNNSNGYNCTDNKTSLINYMFLDKFYDIFEEYKNNKLYIIGESYGGHYVPQVAMRIIEFQNDTTNFTNSKLIHKNMNGFLLGNPSIIGDELEGPNRWAYMIYMWTHALLPQTTWIELNQKCQGWSTFLTNCSEQGDLHPSTECSNLINYVFDNYINRTGYDQLNIYAPICHNDGTNSDYYNYMGYYPGYNACLDNWTPMYMNRMDVLQSIHAYQHYTRTYPDLPNNWYYQNGTYNSNQLFPMFFEQEPQWRITVVNGDADSAVSHIGSQRWIECLNRKVIKRWSYWHQSDGDIGGAVQVYDGITYQTIKHCGHTIPTYCGQNGLTFFSQFVDGTFSS